MNRATIRGEIMWLTLLYLLYVLDFVPETYLSLFRIRLDCWLVCRFASHTVENSKLHINSYKCIHFHVHSLQRHVHIKKPSVSSWKASQCYSSPIQERRELSTFSSMSRSLFLVFMGLRQHVEPSAWPVDKTVSLQGCLIKFQCSKLYSSSPIEKKRKERKQCSFLKQAQLQSLKKDLMWTRPPWGSPPLWNCSRPC